MKLIKTGEYVIETSSVNATTLKDLMGTFSYYNPKTEQTKSSIKVTKGSIYVPRNINKLTKIFGNNLEIIDKTLVPSISAPFSLSDTFDLKPEQHEAMISVLSKLLKGDNSAVLKAPPGFGKSYTLPYVVNSLQTNTLIIVDRTNLAEQMMSEFSANCKDLSITVLGGKNKVPTSVTIVTFQFLIRNKDFMKTYRDFFGFIVVDECHVIGSDVFTTVVGKFNAKYRLGLSATPTRSDFMTELLFDVMGTSFVSGKSADNLNVNMVMVDHPAKFAYVYGNYRNEYAKFLIYKGIALDVKSICKNFKTLNRFGLIYITETDAQLYYAWVLRKAGLRVGVINKDTPKEDRLLYIKKMEIEELDIIISGAILQKGISIKRLDYIINLSNLTKEAHEQLVGRLRRHHKTKKEPLFLDFLFGGHALSKSWDREELARNLKREHSDKFTKITIQKLLIEIKKQSDKVKKT
jgi:superfamily II DNA or RNA helicase